MTQEEELLFKDLCARHPYGVKFKTPDYDNEVLGNVDSGEMWINASYDVDEVKPYLRPMSSMTDEERKEFKHIAPGICVIDGILIPNIPQVDWLNAHHFDYRGLIEKGLALEAPEGMYN